MLSDWFFWFSVTIEIGVSLLVVEMIRRVCLGKQQVYCRFVVCVSKFNSFSNDKAQLNYIGAEKYYTQLKHCCWTNQTFVIVIFCIINECILEMCLSPFG